MDRLIKTRKPVRMSFTKTFNSLISVLESVNPSEEEIRLQHNKLERLGVELFDIDARILDELVDSSDEGAYETEYKVIEEYKDKLDLVRHKIEVFLTSKTSARAHSVETDGHTGKKSLKLPKIELRKFSGEIKDWLGFWSQFQRIHDDPDIEKEDKFQYLIQTTVEGSRAREIVCSFPPTAENYDKAIEGLQSRFGREELLVELYVRELLGLVVQNASSKNRISPQQLYDRLESHLRSLESLGMTGDKYAAFLFPLVESSLPEDLLRVWLRSVVKPTETTDKSGQVYTERLNQLLTFLKNEVEGEERILMAQNGFQTKQFSTGKAKEKLSESRSVPTANDLFSGEVKKPSNNCVFCKKSHESKDCYRAQKMQLEEKKNVLKKEGCCFSCFKPGHRAKACKQRVKCIVCGRQHLVLFCPDLGNTKQKVDEQKEEVKEEHKVVNMNSHVCTQEIVLQTLLVKLKGGNAKEKNSESVS